MPEISEPNAGRIINFVAMSRPAIDPPLPTVDPDESQRPPRWPEEQEEDTNSPKTTPKPRQEPPQVDPPRPVEPRVSGTVDQGNREPSDDIRIGLWGAPRAGKTTYLNALTIAAQKPVMGHNWTISGCDPLSVHFLRGSIKRFIRDKKFPPPTKGYSTFAWRFEGTRYREPRGKVFNRLNSVFGGARVDSEFIVELQDVAGEGYGEEMAEQYEAVQSHLQEAQGIVYVFDPIGNSEGGINGFDFYYETVDRLKTAMRAEGKLVAGKLPHFVSVCVTKFDDPRVFAAAMDAAVIYQRDDNEMPEVPSKIAPEFLSSLCLDDGAKYVCESLKTDFLPGRVEYFATSSVGFRLNNGNFDRKNFTNATQDGGFHAAAHPINVLEPIISLARRIRNESGVV
jgi:hypothetical protein